MKNQQDQYLALWDKIGEEIKKEKPLSLKGLIKIKPWGVSNKKRVRIKFMDLMVEREKVADFEVTKYKDSVFVSPVAYYQEGRIFESNFAGLIGLTAKSGKTIEDSVRKIFYEKIFWHEYEIISIKEIEKL